MQEQPVKQSSKKKWYTRWWGILIIIFMFLPFLSGFLGSSMDSAYEEPITNQTQDNAGEPAAKPDYKIKVVGNTFADDTRRRLTFTVTNTGVVDANPACNIRIQSPDGQYQGIDYVTWDTLLKPGETKYFEGLVTISRDGAAYATKSEVSCLEKSY
ncbi:hypothetical protein FJZ39_03855 [Candidatus Saccharibacteria bacterium]|nr:hypothetical protein [Candidatus Saccharibacteria bacterium]